MRRYVRGLVATLLVLLISIIVVAPGAAAPEGRADAPAGRAGAPAGQMTRAVHISLAPPWVDPAETPGLITPYMLLYALDHALVTPLPGDPMAPSLAGPWSLAPA